jgi:hypothetical protein
MTAELYDTSRRPQQKLNGCAMNEDDDEERMLMIRPGGIIIPSKARTQNISIGRNERDEYKQKCEAEEKSDTTLAELHDTIRSLQQKPYGGAMHGDENEEGMQPWTLSTISLHSKSKQGTKRKLESSSRNSSIHDMAAPVESSNAATGWPQIPLPCIMPQRQGMERGTTIKPRAKRRCTRCLQNNGGDAANCNGRKGGKKYGSNACQYFTI